MSGIRPPLRWAGSKRKALPILLEHIPRGISKFIEPFSGSACVSFSVEANELIISDINPRLIEFYSYLKSDPSGLFEIYNGIVEDPSSYYEIREIFNSMPPSLKRASYFLFLNRNCFNGIYRVNKSGDFNVPWGGDNSGKKLSINELFNASKVIQSANLLCCDFEEAIRNNVRKDDFVYLDPPYAQNENRVFKEYYNESFSTVDWSRLLGVIHYIDSVGAKFLLSYAGDPSLIEDLKPWNIGRLEVTRNVGGFKSSRRKHSEFMASNLG